MITQTRNVEFDLLRVIGIFFVMLIHSPITGEIESNFIVYFLKDFIASGAVPTFFILSGYLGAKKLENVSLNIGLYFKEKLGSLIIPFLFWNGIVLVLVFVAKLTGAASLSRASGAYFDVNFNLWSILCALLGVGRSPIVYQFWFLRDLILVVFIAFFLCRYTPKIPLFPLLLLLIPLSPITSLGYYLLGNYLFVYLPFERFPSPRSSAIYCSAWILMGVAAFNGFLALPNPMRQVGSSAFLFMLAIILAKKSIGLSFSRFGPGVFFIYATHEPLQTICAKLWEKTNLPFYGTVFCYLLIPFLIFPICFFSYRGLRKMTPQLLEVATGGR